MYSFHLSEIWFPARPKLPLPSFVYLFPCIRKLLLLAADFQISKPEGLNYILSNSLGRESKKCDSQVSTLKSWCFCCRLSSLKNAYE